MNQDIKLCYFGGSGGFIFLHLLLLSKQYTCCFQQNESVSGAIAKQWRIKDSQPWKSTETWPDNSATLGLETKQSKIYFFCNPVKQDIQLFPGRTVLLYTDKNSHIELAHFKKAWLFNPYGNSFYNYVSYYRHQFSSWQFHYNNIKDPSWPKCLSPRSFPKLPDHIKKELLQHPNTAQLLKIKKYERYNRLKTLVTYYKNKLKPASILPNGDKVLKEVSDFFPHADVAISLQDVIKQPKILENLTRVPVNTDQLNLRDRWLSLHPDWLLKKINLL